MCDKCNKCQDPCKKPCNPCDEKPICGCKEFVNAKCVIYDAMTLLPLEVISGDNLEDIIIKINNYLASLQNDIDNAFVGQNVGNKAEIYKGTSKEGFEQFRTIEEAQGIIISQKDETIAIGLDLDFIRTQVKAISIANVGIGVDTVRLNQDGSYGMKRIGSGNGSINIIDNDVNGIDIRINPDLFQQFLNSLDIHTAGSDGTGVQVFNGINNKRLGISSIKSTTLSVEKQQDGTIFIDTAKGFDYLKSFYVNNKYIPTSESPSDGSIIRPYTNYEDALRAYIGNGTVIDPQFSGSKIVLQSDSDISKPFLANNLTIEFEDNTQLTYIGNSSYVIDSEDYFPLLYNVSNNSLKKNFVVNLIGNGTITRTSIGGIMRWLPITAQRGGKPLYQGHRMSINIGLNESDTIKFKEYFIPVTDPIFTTNMVFQNGNTIESSYGSPFKLTTSLSTPSVPTFYLGKVGEGVFDYGVYIEGILEIQRWINKTIYTEVDSFLYGNKITIVQHINSHATTSTSLQQDGFYLPLPGSVYVEINGTLYLKYLEAKNTNDFGVQKYESFLKVGPSGRNERTTISASTPKKFSKFIDMSSSNSNVFSVNYDSKIKNSIEAYYDIFLDTNQNPFTLIAKSTYINKSGIISNNTNSFIIDTGGEISRIFDNSVINPIPVYSSNDEAKQAGMLIGSIYKEFATAKLVQVV